MRIGAWTHTIESSQAALDGVPIPPRIQELGWSGPHLPDQPGQSPEAQPACDAAVERWSLRDRLRTIQPGRQQRACGLAPISHVHIGPGWQHGLATCKSVHACPTCSARLRVSRTADVQQCITWWSEEHHGQIAMLTLTVRHAAMHDLRDLRAGLTEAWSAMWKTRQGRILRKSVAHYVRALDVTWGQAHGWHPHIHALLFSEPGALDDGWLAQVTELWADAVQRHLGPEFRPRTDEVGCHLSLNPARAEYLLKLGLEVGIITSKQAKPGRFSPWQIARAAVDEQAAKSSDRTWRNRWKTWVLGMQGARHLSWSRYLRMMADLDPEEDEQLELDLELVRDDRWILSISPGDWSWTFGGWATRQAWSYVRRPSVLLGRSRKGLPETLAYLAQVGLEPRKTVPLDILGRTYTLVVMRRKTDTILRR